MEVNQEKIPERKSRRRKKRKGRNLENHHENQTASLRHRNDIINLAMKTRYKLFPKDYVNKKDEFTDLSNDDKINLKNIIGIDTKKKNLNFGPRTYEKLLTFIKNNPESKTLTLKNS